MSDLYPAGHEGWARLNEAIEHFEEAPAAPHYVVSPAIGLLSVSWDEVIPQPQWEPEHTRPDWDDYFLDIARAVAARADCRRRKVGAVIVGPDHRILSSGYNGAPAGQPGCLSGACPRGLLSYDEVKEFSDYSQGPGRCVSLHAELNAVVHLGKPSIPAGSTIYITDQPCDGCSKAIAAAGITRIITPGGTA